MLSSIPRNAPAYAVGLSSEHLQLIGHICAAWAQVEQATDMLICRLARIDQPTLKIMLDGKLMRGKMDMLKELAERCQHKHTPELYKPIYAHLIKFIHKRNDAVHGMWTSDAKPVAMMYYKGRQLPAAELQEIAEALNRISCHLWHLLWLHMGNFSDEHSPWHDRLEPLAP